MKILIKVTKEILHHSAMCGHDGKMRSTNCAIALAVRELFPSASIGNPNYSLNGKDGFDNNYLPPKAVAFITRFDSTSPSERRWMKPFSFELDVPNSVIDQIGISEAYRILSESKTLELVSL